MRLRILAVIPARAGSKGIPNKNIRLVGGHPLVYYAIHTAKECSVITDVIVTTDSPEVKIIAEQMDVACHERPASLSGDEVTLDPVIYDAIPKDTAWDYIITMQPTSPTLTVGTLTKAIYYAIFHRVDTLISAINVPHLSWRREDGKTVPNYTKRCNRQQLPPNYMETGAFVISKAEAVTETTRIGDNVDIYEIPEEESQDIDTFADIQSVNNALTRKKVGIYVNGSPSIGVGHIYRALELADEFYTIPDIYYDVNQTDPIVFGNTTHCLIGVNGTAELFEHCKEKQYTLFINDILSTSLSYMSELRTVLPRARILNFEDDGEGVFKADLVINALYQKSNLPQIFAGEKYYIIRKMFLFYQPITIRPKVKRVLVTFGGADPRDYTRRLLAIIRKTEYAEYQFVVVLGRMKQGIKQLLSYNEQSNLEVLYDVPNMAEIMSSCDIGITSRGRTAYELAILGIPTIAMSQNEREERHDFICNENGFTYIGLDPGDEIIEGALRMYLGLSQKNRLRFQQRLLQHDLRRGRVNVMNLIHWLCQE